MKTLQSFWRTRLRCLNNSQMKTKEYFAYVSTTKRALLDQKSICHLHKWFYLNVYQCCWLPGSQKWMGLENMLLNLFLERFLTCFELRLTNRCAAIWEEILFNESSSSSSNLNYKVLPNSLEPPHHRLIAELSNETWMELMIWQVPLVQSVYCTTRYPIQVILFAAMYSCREKTVKVQDLLRWHQLWRDVWF